MAGRDLQAAGRGIHADRQPTRRRRRDAAIDDSAAGREQLGGGGAGEHVPARPAVAAENDGPAVEIGPQRRGKPPGHVGREPAADNSPHARNADDQRIRGHPNLRILCCSAAGGSEGKSSNSVRRGPMVDQIRGMHERQPGTSGMEAAESRPTGSLAALAVGLALGLCGAAPRACYCRDVSAGSRSASAYTIAAPDVLELAIASRPDLNHRVQLDSDGAMRLDSDVRPRVEGLTSAEVTDKLAGEMHVSPDEIQVRVAEFASRQVFLCGPVAGTERAIPYQGPEPVADFLRRIGGLSREAEPSDVHVVRANVAAGRRPEVFPVDLRAILIDKDDKTNVVLQPYDQVYVGESARAVWDKCLPPWLHLGSRQQTAGGMQ